MPKKKFGSPRINAPLLRSRLKLKSLQSHSILKAHHPQVVGYLEAAGVRPGSLRAHAAKLLAAGATASSLIFSPPAVLPAIATAPAALALPESTPQVFTTPFDLQAHVVEALTTLLPRKPGGDLGEFREQQISRLLHDTLGIHATAELEGNRLNTAYGLIGAEQHLPRFPGDTISQHDEFQEKGLTPGRGAWGYFAQSRATLTPQLHQYEKYYVAVQTLYLPDWHIRLPYLRDWYKHRKVILVNPKNGHAVVAVVGDSGPAAWTGKHFGGSPEVMATLRMVDGRAKGPVLLFFVDDPNGEVPVGPLEYNLEKGLPLPAPEQ